MNNTNTGGPAFPRPFSGTRQVAQEGMTLRDYFAAKAMQAFMARNWAHHQGTDQELIDTLALSAYIMADAMLRAREGGAA